MKLYKIVMKKEIQPLPHFEEIVKNNFMILGENTKTFQYEVERRDDMDWTYYYCRFWPRFEHTIEFFDQIYAIITQSISEYIMNCKEEEVIRDILTQEFGFKSIEEQDQVLPFVFHLLNEEEYGGEGELERKRRMQEKIKKKAEDFLLLENTLAIDGFIRFRLKEEWEEWKLVTEHAVDEFLMDKEYKEFIEFVRHLVSIQVPTIELLHVIHIDDKNFWLFDQDWQEISTMSSGNGLLAEGENKVHYEELVLSQLISIAPHHIILHTDQENHHIIYTIKKVFEDKIAICRDCQGCQSLIGKIQMGQICELNDR
ncbi:putative sporulation protein YtxC [Ammoniphilus resinae]|uniref:Sporulation protein YtxC n=1 Tax=Ammoniphilus resinae TaxID=861532 RepID=A0ABS4GJQ4_9BACL|nr:putative sporulation protein YtxC [Ammoniphilus resinae]MBP1930322.1 putative sporulation protein YtxC [Ammoniphilus resinae]